MRYRCFLLFVIIRVSYASVMPYISPGVMIAWNNSKVKTINLKISIGCTIPVQGRAIDACFTNITIGRRVSTETPLGPRDYSYSEIEFGMLKGPVFGGMGIGVALEKDPQNNRRYLLPKGSAFVGDVLFVRTDAVIENHNLDIDIGGMLVVPFCRALFRLKGSDLSGTDGSLLVIPVEQSGS